MAVRLKEHYSEFSTIKWPLRSPVMNPVNSCGTRRGLFELWILCTVKKKKHMRLTYKQMTVMFVETWQHDESMQPIFSRIDVAIVKCFAPFVGKSTKNKF